MKKYEPYRRHLKSVAKIDIWTVQKKLKLLCWCKFGNFFRTNKTRWSTVYLHIQMLWHMCSIRSDKWQTMLFITRFYCFYSNSCFKSSENKIWNGVLIVIVAGSCSILPKHSQLSHRKRWWNRSNRTTTEALNAVQSLCVTFLFRSRLKQAKRL